MNDEQCCSRVDGRCEVTQKIHTQQGLVKRQNEFIWVEMHGGVNQNFIAYNMH